MSSAEQQYRQTLLKDGWSEKMWHARQNGAPPSAKEQRLRTLWNDLQDERDWYGRFDCTPEEFQAHVISADKARCAFTDALREARESGIFRSTPDNAFDGKRAINFIPMRYHQGVREVLESLRHEIVKETTAKLKSAGRDLAKPFIDGRITYGEHVAYDPSIPLNVQLKELSDAMCAEMDIEMYAEINRVSCEMIPAQTATPTTPSLAD